jgi:hypothetical protein
VAGTDCLSRDMAGGWIAVKVSIRQRESVKDQIVLAAPSRSWRRREVVIVAAERD